MRSMSPQPQPRSSYQNWKSVVHCLVWPSWDLVTHKTTFWHVRGLGPNMGVMAQWPSVRFSPLELDGDRSLTTWQIRDGVTPAGLSTMAVSSYWVDIRRRNLLLILQRSSTRGLEQGQAFISNIPASKGGGRVSKKGNKWKFPFFKTLPMYFDTYIIYNCFNKQMKKLISVSPVLYLTPIMSFSTSLGPTTLYWTMGSIIPRKWPSMALRVS